MARRQIGVGLYGENGHQIHRELEKSGFAKLVATSTFSSQHLSSDLRSVAREYTTLEEMLRDPAVELVSLCSPLRRDQVADAIRCLRAGKHVYAEKPCAMHEADLDAILATAHESGRSFREMAGTAFGRPYLAMRELVCAGTIGEIVQITAEKSYPYHDNRPQDEDIDGGLIGQCSIHALRWVEHVAAVKIRSVHAAETSMGNPAMGGDLRMAATLMLRLENDGLASITANYLNPRGTGIWGYESLRLFGARGMMESVEGGARTRLVVDDQDRGPIAMGTSLDYFEAYARSLVDGTPMPLTSEDEVSPTRWAIRAKQALVS